MHVLDLIQSTRNCALTIYHSDSCPSDRTGRKRHECTCNAEKYLQELRAQLRSIQVPDWLVKDIGGKVAKQARQNGSGGSGNSFDSVRDAMSTVRFTEAQAMELIEIIGDRTQP